MISSIYVLIVTLLIFIFSFLASKWSQLQMDLFTGAVGLLVTIAATMEIILATPGSNAPPEESTIRIGEYIILLVIIHIAFGIFIISIFKSYQRNYNKLMRVTVADNHADKKIWFQFMICVFGYSISLLASATIYAANISIVGNHKELLEILRSVNASGGDVGLILKTIFLPNEMKIYYYPVFLLLAALCFSIVLAWHLFSKGLFSTHTEPEHKE